MDEVCGDYFIEKHSFIFFKSINIFKIFFFFHNFQTK